MITYQITNRLFAVTGRNFSFLLFYLKIGLFTSLLSVYWAIFSKFVVGSSGLGLLGLFDKESVFLRDDKNL
jgi:hypothetical protein